MAEKQKKGWSVVKQDIIDEMLSLTLKEALKDGGLWCDGKHLYFRQLKLGKIEINYKGGLS